MHRDSKPGSWKPGHCPCTRHTFQLTGMPDVETAGSPPGRKARMLPMKMEMEKEEEETAAQGRKTTGLVGRGQRDGRWGRGVSFHSLQAGAFKK